MHGRKPLAIGSFIVYEGDPKAPYDGPEGVYAIYALVDPTDNTVRYIGQTIDPCLSGCLP
jgi:hypothetical protein